MKSFKIKHRWNKSPNIVVSAFSLENLWKLKSVSVKKLEKMGINNLWKSQEEKFQQARLTAAMLLKKGSLI